MERKCELNINANEINASRDDKGFFVFNHHVLISGPQQELLKASPEVTFRCPKTGHLYSVDSNVILNGNTIKCKNEDGWTVNLTFHLAPPMPDAPEKKKSTLIAISIVLAAALVLGFLLFP